MTVDNFIGNLDEAYFYQSMSYDYPQTKCNLKQVSSNEPDFYITDEKWIFFRGNIFYFFSVLHKTT